MPMHIPSSIGTGSSTPLFRMDPITNPLSLATQSDILGILQREQDHALSLLSSSPLLSSLFISYANRVVTLKSVSATPSPESEEWKTLQTTTAALREENEKLKSENREMVEKLEAAEASQEAFRFQVSSLKEVNTTQHTDIKFLWAELFEAGDKCDQLMEDWNAEKSALQAQVLDLEAQRRGLKETVVKQLIKISKLERLTVGDAPTHQLPSPPAFPIGQRVPTASTPSSPNLHVRTPLSEQGEAVPTPDFCGKSERPVPAPQQQHGKRLSSGWLESLGHELV